MDMINQMLNRMQTVAGPQANERQTANRERSEGGDDFDSLVRKKQEAAKAGDSSGSEATDKKSGPQTSAGTSEKDAKAEVDAAGEQPAVPADQYTMAVAMMLQPQIVPMSGEIPAESVEETAIPQSEQLLAPDGVDLPVTQPVTEAPAEQQQQAAADGSETRLPQSEELPVARMSGKAERASAPEFQQIARQVAGELTGSVARQFTQKAEDEDDEQGVAVETAEIGVPVFEPMSAVPVKVAEAPVPLEAEDGVEQIGARIEGLLTNENGDQTVELTLSPAELGTVRVSITHALDGALYIQMSATTERAANLLERGVVSLQNQLIANGRPTVEIEVRAAENAQQQFLNPNDQQREQQQRQQNGQRRQDRRENERTEDFLAKLRIETL